jgi:catechol 2,3-dioxygenase-like lactoylglutathione lyase family enzyme
MSADLAAAAVAQIAIRVHDVDRAAAFYRDRLGLPLLFQFPGLAFFQSGAVRLMLSLPEKPEFDHPGSVVYFKVGELEQVHETLSGRGVEFVDAPHVVHRAATYELWMAFFRDSEGNPLALMEERPLAPA